MPSATWRGTVSFGLVAVPVRMYRASESGGVSFRMLCRSCGTPIQNRRWCPEEERLIDWNDVQRGFEVARGEFTEVTDSDLERLPLPSTDTIEVLDVVAETEVDAALYLEQSYYLEPEPAGVRPYALLREALRQTGRSAIGKIALRQREHLCQLAARDEVLLLNTLHWPDEIRGTDSLRLPEAKGEVAKRELAMAVTLLDNLTTSFDPSQYRDDYREALLEVVEAKRERRRLPRAKPAPRGDNVVDLMAALKQAVAETSPKRRRDVGRNGRQAPRSARPKPAEQRSATARRRASWPSLSGRGWSRRPRSVVVAVTADGVTERAQDPERQPDQHQDHPDGPEHRERQNEADYQQDDAKNDHAESSFRSALGPCRGRSAPAALSSPALAAQARRGYTATHG